MDFGDKKTPNYPCKICYFNTCNKKDYLRHIMTKKHKFNEFVTFGDNFTPKNPTLICDNCCKTYKSRNGLWCHKKRCVKKIETSEKMSESSPIDNYLIIELLKQNQDFKEQIMELVKKDMIITNNTINNTTNNNQKFNMNFFLNEQCKGALDIMEFVNSLNVQLSDLENTGSVGYVKGISDIFLRNLRELDIYKRPIHCSDLKREVLYVKDNNVWEKDEDKKKVKKAIQYISGKNFNQIKEWVEINPDAKDVRTKKHDQYMCILSKCTGGIDKAEDDILYNKIISNVAKEIIIDKGVTHINL